MNPHKIKLPQIQILGVLLIAVVGSLSANAQIENGGFESWSGNSPDGWTTIDSGIELARTTSPAQEGSRAARVTVITRTQSNTDLRQRVQLQANQTYRFKTSIYHTEGNVRARLYVKNYLGYSNPGLTNQWQTLEHTYTPNQDEEISVGLRFYDLGGFDGSEVVFVDNFRPGSSVTPPSSGCSDTEVSISVRSDNYGSETTWQLFDANNRVLGGDSNFPNNTTRTKAFCLADGDYRFNIADSYGDGICCQQGNGEFTITVAGQQVASGGEFTTSDNRTFTVGSGNSGGGNSGSLDGYYQTVSGLTGFALKTGLHNLIKGHSAQGYGALWGFYSATEIDRYYENDGSILDIYSERPAASDPYTYQVVSDQCGNFSQEGDCYNREHSFPRSWFGGSIEPMNSDVHHIFASDGKVNSIRGSYPYGEVGNATVTTQNGSKRGAARSGLGHNGTVFEPIGEFKGDIARAQLYMATRYENAVAGWENNSSSSNAVLNGNSSSVFEGWYITMLKRWHAEDPVSQKERDRNDDAFTYQGNRNPFVDHPEFVNLIWGN